MNSENRNKSDGTRLYSLMKKASEPPKNYVDDYVIGTVLSVSPLSIRVGNDTRDVILSSSFVHLTGVCKPKQTIIDFSSDSVYNQYVQELGLPSKITCNLWPGIQVGDTVGMIKLGKGQRYIAIDIIGG